MMEKLKQIYGTYIEELTQVKKSSGPLADVFGSGGTKNHPCHTIFYHALGEWVESFLAREPEEEEIFRAAGHILSAAAGQRKKPAYWYCFASQSFIKKLIPLLGADRCRTLRQTFDELYPERERLPVNQEVYELLCAKAGCVPKKKSFWSFFG